MAALRRSMAVSGAETLIEPAARADSEACVGVGAAAPWTVEFDTALFPLTRPVVENKSLTKKASEVTNEHAEIFKRQCESCFGIFFPQLGLQFAFVCDWPQSLSGERNGRRSIR